MKDKPDEAMLNVAKETVNTALRDLELAGTNNEYVRLAMGNLDAVIFWLDKAVDDITNGRDVLAGQLATAIVDDDDDLIAEIAKKAWDRGIEFEDICPPNTEEFIKAEKIIKEQPWFVEKELLN